MAYWQISEMSKLTKVSVRMLRHYEKVGLLKPCMRRSNGYRCYSEQDLVTLQQIISLKFFGFSLSQIKEMLESGASVQDHLLAQQRALKAQAEELREVEDVLEKVLVQCKESGSPQRKDLLDLIERYHMAAELKKTWIGKQPEQLQEYMVNFKQRFTDIFDEWFEVNELIRNGQMGDPCGPDGARAVKAITDWGEKASCVGGDHLYASSEEQDAFVKKCAEAEKKNATFTEEQKDWMTRALDFQGRKLWKETSAKVEQFKKSFPQSAFKVSDGTLVSEAGVKQAAEVFKGNLAKMGNTSGYAESMLYTSARQVEKALKSDKPDNVKLRVIVSMETMLQATRKALDSLKA